MLNRTFILDDHDYQLTASIGISIFPDKILKSSVILHQAETAMHQDKSEDHNRICFFKQIIHKEAEYLLLAFSLDFFFD